jgi:transposase
MPNFKPYNQSQAMLLPPALSDCLPEDHICFVVNDVVETMDLRVIDSSYSDKGASAYDPRLMIKVLFYGYIQGVCSSRKLEAKTYEDIGYRFLAANRQPDHGTINLFRKNHLKALEEVFAQIVLLTNSLGMVDLCDISIDGSKIKASASKKNLFTQEEIDRLKSKFADFFIEAEALDRKEDKLFGSGRGHGAMPADLIDRAKRKEAIAKMKAKLEKLNEAEKIIKDKQSQIKSKEDKELKKNSTSNTTDPDANLLKMKNNSYKMAYNTQVSSSRQVILAYNINAESDDNSSLVPMIKETENNTGKEVQTVKADAGYSGKENLSFCQDRGIDAYIPDRKKTIEEKQERNNDIPKYDRRKFNYDEKKDEFFCPEGKRLKYSETRANGSKKYIGQDCEHCPTRKLCTKGKCRSITYDHKAEMQIRAMRDKLNSEKGKNKYLERMSDVEPIFGDMIYNRHFTHFLCRGKPMVLIELGLISCAHNLVKIFNYLKKEKKNRKDVQWNTLMRLRAAA